MGGYYEEKNFVYTDEHGNGSIFICGVRHRTGTETSASDNSKTEETGTEAAEQPTSDNPYAAYAGTTTV